MNHYTYSVEIYDNNLQRWVTELRHYQLAKDLNAFDLHDIPGKRRNAQFLGKTLIAE